MMTVKKVNGMIEKTVVVNGVVFYTRLRDRSNEQPKAEYVQPEQSNEEIKVEIPKFDYNESTQGSYEESTAHEKVADFEERFQKMSAEFEQRRRCEVVCHELIKRNRRRFQPKNRLHKAMDMVGIDRAAIYYMLEDLERRL